MKKIAVYNGSFDPVTNGHLDIIERAAKIFDVLYVTIAIHPTKVGLFTIEQRKENTELTIKLGEMINRGGELYGELQKYKQVLDEIVQTISTSIQIQDIPQTQMECTQYFLSVSEAKLQKILNIIKKVKEK